MASAVQSNRIDPSDYVTQHLHHFTTSSQQTGWPFNGHHAVAFPNPYALLLPVALFVVLASFAAFNDRGAVFRLVTPMSLLRRLSVWWSCAWRLWVVSLLMGLVSAIAFAQFARRLQAPMMQQAVNLAHGDGWYANLVAAAAAMVPLVAGPLVVVLLSLPVTGYVIRRALATHALAVPEMLNVWQATLLGATTLVWTGIGTLLVANLTVPFQRDVAAGLDLLFSVVWGMYVVLPRQIRRARRMVAGAHQA